MMTYQKVFMVKNSMSDVFFLEQTLTHNMQNLHSTLHSKPSNEFAQWIQSFSLTCQNVNITDHE